MDQYFSKDDLYDLTGIIKSHEQSTSCEIVVRISSDKVIPEQAARSEFMQLGLGKSDERLSLFLYISLFQRKFVFLADDAIFEKLGDDWLDPHADMLEDRFRKYQFGFGLHDVIARIGLDLKKHFPVD